MKSFSINKVALLAVLLFILISCKERCSKLCYTGVPEQIIDVSQAEQMYQEYRTNFAPIIEEAKSEQGNPYLTTHFAYVDLQQMKKYIAFLEEVERLNNKKISGLRFYFAAYPNSPKMTNGKATKHKGRETFFIAPTMQIENSKIVRGTLPYNFMNLRNLPFYIKPNNKKNKYIGEFKVINSLLYSKDFGKTINSKIGDTLQKTNETNEKTSVIMNDFALTPPPK